MVDKAMFIGMGGAQSSMHQLEILTNNLANVNTTAFRSDSEVMRSYKVNEDGQQSRVYAAISDTYTDFHPGPILNTGRDLDIAIEEEGFIAVQTKSGQEAYTRAGNLDLTKDGLLVTKDGHMVMGNSGVITIPPAEGLTIGPNGTISVRLKGTDDIVNINRIRLVNPPVSQLYKGADGLFYLAEGTPAPPDEKISILKGALEGSNVNAIETLTKLIDLSRNYEMHTSMMKTIGDNLSTSNQLLNVQR